jgi:hypothetical protein
MRCLHTSILVALLLALAPVAVHAQVLNVAYTTNDITADPDSEVWNAVAPVVINLGPQQIVAPHGGKGVSVSVRAVHNGRFIGFLVEWNDTSQDTRVTAEAYPDRVALQFPVETGGTPSPFMGGPGLVNIWLWRADLEAAERGYLDAEYPPYQGIYFPQDERFRKDTEGVEMQGSVEDLIARGFGTLEAQAHQDMDGKGVYKNGKWKVAFVRPMVTSDEYDAQFKPGTETRINLAVWEGSNKDRGGQKSVSMFWTPMKITEASSIPLLGPLEDIFKR